MVPSPKSRVCSCTCCLCFSSELKCNVSPSLPEITLFHCILSASAGFHGYQQKSQGKQNWSVTRKQTRNQFLFTRRRKSKDARHSMCFYVYSFSSHFCLFPLSVQALTLCRVPKHLISCYHHGAQASCQRKVQIKMAWEDYGPEVLFNHCRLPMPRKECWIWVLSQSDVPRLIM